MGRINLEDLWKLLILIAVTLIAVVGAVEIVQISKYVRINGVSTKGVSIVIPYIKRF